ncbi:MAG TPA: hypothetical protein VG713_08125, partial [Pirellulales bacterium]|nr:hypothetical protein [Pirellulales bacterium]
GFGEAGDAGDAPVVDEPHEHGLIGAPAGGERGAAIDPTLAGTLCGAPLGLMIAGVVIYLYR